jgi:FAD/FMN-containing dehydrogenase
VDAEARYEEVLSATLERRYVAERVFHWAKPETIEQAADVLAKSGEVTTFFRESHRSRLPTENWWLARIENLRADLETMQQLEDEDDRQMTLRQAVAKLVELEASVRDERYQEPLTTYLSVHKIKAIVSLEPADQVVVAGGGLNVARLQEELRKVGQCIPFVPIASPVARPRFSFFSNQPSGTLAEAISFNQPHALEAQCGNWRDWILGMKVLLPDGTLVKSGSSVVKNVAGYDAHKLFVGSRDTLGVIVEVTLKTTPMASLPQPEVEVRFEVPRALPRIAELQKKKIWVQRTRPTDFASALKGADSQLLEIDRASSTLWAEVPYDQELPRYTGDGVLRQNCLDKNLRIANPTEVRLMKEAKKIFDPANKLNPGELGVL